MKTVKSIAALRSWPRNIAHPVVLVPTMGALHEGHAALIRQARKMAGRHGSVVVSIFVNPIQFGPKEDFASYPRPLRNDLAVCRAADADVVFAPPADEMYLSDRSVIVDETTLSNALCGRSRPGHFRGVCTVVAKLFLIAQPTHAIFGEKDWQQLAILRRMVRDLNFPIEVVGHPTVRESDGLATSSRNAYLTVDERLLAPRIHEALVTAAKLKSPESVITAAKRDISKIPGARIDYVEAVDAETLEPLLRRKRSGRLAAAVFLGRARLIDNIPLPPVP